MATCEKLENNRAKLTVTIPAETFAEATQKAYIKSVKHYNVPGFRKGKAPRKVIENMYGPEVFFEDAFELIWGDWYDAALNEHDLTAVDRPSLDIETISLSDGVVFTAEVQLKPEVTLGAYKGIEVPAPTYTVEDSQVDAEIEKELEKNARFIDVDRAVETGDRVMLNYSGSVDGEKFQGGTAEDVPLLIGSGTFIPGFEEQIVGMKAGDEKEINVTFPAEYAEQLAGKDAVFAIKINAVQKKELPALDDEFAKDISEFDTLDALKADKKQKLAEQAAERSRIAAENAAVQVVCDNATVEIPAVMVDRQINHMVQDIAYRLQMNGMSLDDYLKYAGLTAETMRESYRAEAQQRVKMQLVIEAIEKAEALKCSDEDLQKEIADYAKRNGMTAEELEKNLSDDDREYMRDRVLADKAVGFVLDHATIVEPKAEEAPAEDAPAPKKKAPAKKKAAPKKEAPAAE